MARKQVFEGDVITIPFAGGVAAGKIIYVSQYFANIVGMLIFGRRFDSPPTIAELDGEFMADVHYTAASGIPHLWPVIGRLPVTDADRALTRRIVEVRLWELDRELGLASEEELRQLPQMGVTGLYGIQNMLKRLFG